MIRTDLSMEYFTKYFEKNKLGKLYLPNGLVNTLDGNAGTSQFFINLTDLYKLATGWKINRTEVPLKDIFEIICFGDSVQHPGFREEGFERRKYFVAGPKVTRIRKEVIKPKYADFLVITESGKCYSEKSLDPTTVMVGMDYRDSVPVMTEGGINVTYRGIGEISHKSTINDPTIADMIKKGVPIFSNGILEEIVGRSIISKETPRTIYWDETRNGLLTGKIE
nr:hypothetical protein [Nanoarchaeum sp.]